MFLFQDFHDAVHGSIFKSHNVLLTNLAGDDLTGGKGIGSCAAVSVDQSGHPQFDPSEVADDHDEELGEITAQDLAVDGFACRTRRFSVIVDPEERMLKTNPVCITVVACIIVLLSQGCKAFLHLLLRGHGICEGKELAALVTETPMAFPGNGSVCISFLQSAALRTRAKLN